jgi:Na+/melibiose symporter-like transporter
VFAWLPLLGSILGVIALYFYNLDEATVEANAQKLIEMKAAAAAEETKAE